MLPFSWERKREYCLIRKTIPVTVILAPFILVNSASVKSYWNARVGIRKWNGQPLGWIESTQTALCVEVHAWHVQRPEKLALKFLKLRQWINSLKSDVQCVKIKYVGVTACQHVTFFCLMVHFDNRQFSSEPHSLLCVISSPLAWGISDFSKYKFRSPSFLT